MKQTGVKITGYRIDKRGKLVKTGTHRTIVDRIRERSSPKTKFKRGK